MMKHVMDPVPQIKQVRPDLPDDFEEVIFKSMAKERNERYPSARDLSTALTAITQKTQQSDLESELRAMQVDLNAASEEPEQAAEPPIEPEPVPEPEPLSSVETPPPAEPTPSEELETPTGTFSEATPVVERAPEQRSKIPLWVWAMVAMLVIVCIVGISGTAWFINQGGFAALASPTDTPAAVRAENVATDTVEPTEAPTDEPTETPLPPTETPEADPATPETAVSDQEATRDSLEATRLAQDEDEGEDDNTTDIEATRAALEELREGTAIETAVAPSFAALFGPEAGSLEHNDENIIQSQYANINVQTFYMEATFLNPYDTSVSGWDIGVTFRQVDINDELRLVIRSDGSWNLNDRFDTEDTFIQEGNIDGCSILMRMDFNTLKMIVLDETGYFFINDEYIDTLDVSGHLDSGDVAIGTGFYTSNTQAGASTDFADYGVWDLTSLSGPESGELEHVDDGFIINSYADASAADFIMKAVFTNPYDPEENSWDYGFSFPRH